MQAAVLEQQVQRLSKQAAAAESSKAVSLQETTELKQQVEALLTQADRQRSQAEKDSSSLQEKLSKALASQHDTESQLTAVGAQLESRCVQYDLCMFLGICGSRHVDMNHTRRCPTDAAIVTLK